MIRCVSISVQMFLKYSLSVYPVSYQHAESNQFSFVVSIIGECKLIQIKFVNDPNPSNEPSMFFKFCAGVFEIFSRFINILSWSLPFLPNMLNPNNSKDYDDTSFQTAFSLL
jgi:hypothetical protein